MCGVASAASHSEVISCELAESPVAGEYPSVVQCWVVLEKPDEAVEAVNRAGVPLVIVVVELMIAGSSPSYLYPYLMG